MRSFISQQITLKERGTDIHPIKRARTSIELPAADYSRSTKRFKPKKSHNHTDDIMVTLKDISVKKFSEKKPEQMISQVNNYKKRIGNVEAAIDSPRKNNSLQTFPNKIKATKLQKHHGRTIYIPITSKKPKKASLNVQTVEYQPIKEQENRELVSMQEKLKYQRELREQVLKLTMQLQQKKELSLESESTESIEQLKAEIESEKTRYRQQRESVEGLSDSISFLERQLEAYEDQRKQIHNYIQHLNGNIRVFCRVKPSPNSVVLFPELMSSLESEKVCVSALAIASSPKAVYVFDRVFTPSATQEHIFNEVSQFLQSALDGEKVCIFAYGQTGSGKTYTMEGPAEDELYVDGKLTAESGVLPRAGEYVFGEIRRLGNKGYEYTVMCSAVEIYNDELLDLLQNDQSEGAPQLMMSIERNGTEIRPLNWINVLTTEQLMDAVKAASKNRRVKKTANNERSSRSHFVFQIKLSFISNAGKTGTGILSVIDLAGSERPTKDPLVAKNPGLMKEAKAINQSLTTLGRVLTMLATRKLAKKSAIPYRESKLTRVLQSCLQPESKTLMFVNISPAVDNVGQTKESLRFASTAAFVC
eukprot:TRINITY_DN8800_c0_g2_i1.p1 TRINITY_DN8800_c0_g2~~TRINITY_DN8800_c0_g2_i1.p1  ORF type:complete len:624 (-),score=98.68 TRINITY_DN8800_c0_g2_i1:196-1965(-)